MKYTIIFFLTSLLVGQSEDATLTIYKDGTALIKQPVGWEIPSGNSYVTWSSLPNGIHRDTPFLNLEGATIISQRFNDNILMAQIISRNSGAKKSRLNPKMEKR
jgi:hypothetical protein